MYGTPIRRQAFPDDAHDLNRSRAKNDHKLKTTFERIFEKYNKDFTDVGDEVDLQTGRIVVNNGHLSGMRNERDPGQDPGRRFVRAFTQELGTSDQLRPRNLADLKRSQETHVEYSKSSTEEEWEDDSEDELASSPLKPPMPDLAGHEIQHAVTKPTLSASHHSPSGPDIDIRPLLDSMKNSFTLPSAPGTVEHSNTDLRSRIDPSQLQNLGISIAGQIASFLNEQFVTPLVRPMRNDPWAVPPFTPAPGNMSNSIFTPEPTYDVLPSLSPSGGASLWTSRGRLETDFVDISQRPSKRQKVMQSIEQDDSVLSDRDVSATPGLEEGRQATPQMEDFYQSARRNFYLLAHGVTNRGFITTNDIENAWDGSPVDEEFTLATRRAPRQSGAATLPRFSRREDAMLIRLREREKWGWDEISALFPDRSVGSLQVRYSRTLKITGARSHRNNIMDLVDDAELIASIPPRHFTKLDYALCSREPSALRESSGPRVTKNGKPVGRPREPWSLRAKARERAEKRLVELSADDIVDPDATPEPTGESREQVVDEGPMDSNIDPQLLDTAEDALAVQTYTRPGSSAPLPLSATVVQMAQPSKDDHARVESPHPRPVSQPDQADPASPVVIKIEDGEVDSNILREADPNRKRRPAQKGPKECAKPRGDKPPRARAGMPRNKTPRDLKREAKAARRREIGSIAESVLHSDEADSLRYTAPPSLRAGIHGASHQDDNDCLRSASVTTGNGMIEALLEDAKKKREEKNARRRAQHARKREEEKKKAAASVAVNAGSAQDDHAADSSTGPSPLPAAANILAVQKMPPIGMFGAPKVSASTSPSRAKSLQPTSKSSDRNARQKQGTPQNPYHNASVNGRSPSNHDQHAQSSLPPARADNPFSIHEGGKRKRSTAPDMAASPSAKKADKSRAGGAATFDSSIGYTSLTSAPVASLQPVLMKRLRSSSPASSDVSRSSPPAPEHSLGLMATAAGPSQSVPIPAARMASLRSVDQETYTAFTKPPSMRPPSFSPVAALSGLGADGNIVDLGSDDELA